MVKSCLKFDAEGQNAAGGDSDKKRQTKISDKY